MPQINNDFYEELGQDWYTADNHPIALLRAENAVRIPWILNSIGHQKTVLDIGCGAGMLTNAFAKKGHTVHGLDISSSSLRVAKAMDETKTVSYVHGSAYELPYPDQVFDVVCALDVLEHVETPLKLLAEASRVLKPGGLFFFHTFNRNFLSYLLVIKGVDIFVPNAPKNMHVYPLFIKPQELELMCRSVGMEVTLTQGFVPKIFSVALLKMLMQRKVPKEFKFCFSKSLKTGYCGFAKKKINNDQNRTI